MSCVKSETEMWRRRTKAPRPPTNHGAKTNALVGPAGTRMRTMPRHLCEYARTSAPLSPPHATAVVGRALRRLADPHRTTRGANEAVGVWFGLPDRGGPLSGCYHLMSGNSFIERLHAARHSPLLMCVAASQKPRQSESALPPPPGLLGAGSRLGEAPPPCSVANWLGKGSDMGDSGGTVDPGCGVVGTVDVVVAGTPPGGVSPAEGVGDKGVNPVAADGAAGAMVPGATLGLVARKVVVGAESLGAASDAGALPADERVCANATWGTSSARAMATRRGGVGVSIAITMTLPAVPWPSNG